MRENLEGRFFYRKENPILFVIQEPRTHLEVNDMNYQLRRIWCRPQQYAEVIHELLENPVDAVYTNIKDQRFLATVFRMGIITYSTVSPERISSKKMVKFGEVVYSYGGKVHDPVMEWLKRFFDVCISIAGISIAGILLLFFGPLIVVESGGSAVYAQKRVGYNGRRFTMYKFRTMKKGTEEDRQRLMKKNEMESQMFKIKNDPRITGIGSILRKTSLDEFPQFFNVLRGEMSVVGTRPPMEDELKNYKPQHKKRLSCKPGITGKWQTSGRNKVTNFDDVVKLDLSYIKNDGIIAYLSMVIKTFYCVIRKDGE